MPLKTTTIGAYPKPDYLPVPDWFRDTAGPDAAAPTRDYSRMLRDRDAAELEELFVRAAGDVIGDQVAAGVDVPTDGEVRRENYIHYHCRHLDGIDFDVLTERALRGGAYTASLPTVRGKVSAREPFLPHDWRVAQAHTERPVKVTLPGPMTITDTVADGHYGDPAALGADLGRALNREVRALAGAGCRWIQVDEPVFARKAAAALDYGLANLMRCFDGVPDGVVRVVHMCCGYPDRLDRDDYPKAPQSSYLELAEAIDRAAIDQISLEDAHRHNDLAGLLPRLRDTAVVFGCVAVARSRVEPVEEIAARLRSALDHIEAERLWAAPDCGLGLLPRASARAKLANMCAAARAL